MARANRHYDFSDEGEMIKPQATKAAASVDHESRAVSEINSIIARQLDICQTDVVNLKSAQSFIQRIRFVHYKNVLFE